MQAGPSQLLEDLASIPPETQTPRATISGDQDLLKLFGVLPLYQEYVQPYVGGNKDERPKMDKGYNHLVSDLPGRYGNPKDTYMLHLVQNPDFMPADIAPLDDQSIRDAFTLQPGQTDHVDELLGLNSRHPVKGKKKKKRPRDSISHIDQVNGVSATGTPEPSDKKKRKL